MPSTASLPLAPSAHPAGRLGDLLDVRRMGLVDFFRDRSRLGEVFALDFLRLRPVVLTNPAHLHHVLVARSDQYPKGESVRNFRLIVGNGLFTADGEVWKAHRSLVQPHFRKAAVESYASSMADAVQAQVEAWERALGTEVDVLDAMMELALDVVGRSMFSHPIGGGAQDLAYHYKRALTEIADRESGLGLPMWVPTPSNLRLRHHKANIDRRIRAEMAARRASGQRKADLLDALLHAGGDAKAPGLTDAEILDELATILIAGHETSALTMAWIFWLLARHPEVEAKVLDELARAGLGPSPAARDLSALPYLRAVVDECLRLYPPVWINPRTALVDDEIGGFFVPKGTMVLAGIYFTHRRPELWPDPDAFRPERFVGVVPDRCHFLPFGVGGRTCAGLAFAYQEILLAMATLLPRFRLRSTRDAHPKLIAIGTLQPEKLPMRLERR